MRIVKYGQSENKVKRDLDGYPAIMSLKRKIPTSCKIVLYSDVHFGAKVTDYKAFNLLMEKIAGNKKVYAACLGDLVEGKRVGGRHYNHLALLSHMRRPGEQYRAFRKAIEKAANSHLVIMPGNHDVYDENNYDPIEETICRPLNIPPGSYQTVLDLGYNMPKLHLFHGDGSIATGGKDPYMKQGAQAASLANKLHRLMDGVDMHAMGHTHRLFTVPPLEQFRLTYSHSKGIQGEKFQLKGSSHIPKEARWYANTGTFRRSGGLGHDDYAERAGYEPEGTGFVVVRLSKGKIVEATPVLLKDFKQNPDYYL